MRPCALWTTIVIVFTTCSGCSTPCEGIHFHEHQPELDHECQGNTGCKEIDPQCGTHCVACDGPRCMGAVSDDTCMPYCPTDRPDDDHDGNCSLVVLGPTCTYPLETCPCGPSDIEWVCDCKDGRWSCAPSGHDCYPCMDGPREAGPPDVGIDGPQEAGPPDAGIDHP